jgi:hypothetical protein
MIFSKSFDLDKNLKIKASQSFHQALLSNTIDDGGTTFGDRTPIVFGKFFSSPI